MSRPGWYRRSKPSPMAVTMPHEGGAIFHCAYLWADQQGRVWPGGRIYPM
jgi:hypothetical protein